MSKVKFKIIDGGKAIPIGNNLYKLEGRSHEEGGIGIELTDGNAKTIIEAERKEIFEPKAHEFRILSNSLKIGNKTPAQLAEAGYNPDIIFKAQQSINGNYGGSYAENGTNKDDIAYNKFVETLPDNQRYTDTTKYDMRRYWELNGKPKNFKESINREEPMFHLEDDGYYHASSIAWNDKGEGEFIKNRNHETIGLEIGSYLRDKNHPLRNKEYILDATGNKIKYRKRTPSETILPEGYYIGDLKENQKYGVGGIIKKIIDSFTNDKKENTNKENKKDAPIDWDEIKIKQAYTESGFNSKAVSKAPAYGLYQITPQTLKEFNDKTGNAYKVEDLYNDKINTEIRDWYMNDLYNREWNTKNNPSDSVRATKTIMAYNMGPTNLVNRLNELKAKGYDIYQSLDWTQDDSIPVESREYNDFILRNQNNSLSRNQLVYEASKKKNADKVEGIRNGFKNGGQINMKLKYKNKQDITDIVMNEILPHSTGERKKFFTGGFWANVGANGLNSLLQGIISPILNYNMANEIEKSGKDLQPAQMSKTYLDSRDHTLKHLLGDVDRTVNKFIDISSKNTNNSKTHMNRVRGFLSDANTKKQAIIGESLNRSDNIRRENAIMSQEVDKFNIANKNQFALINEQNRIDRQAAAMKARMAGDKAILDSSTNLLYGIGTALYDYDKIGLSLLNSENSKAWDFFNEHWGKNWK